MALRGVCCAVDTGKGPVSPMLERFINVFPQNGWFINVHNGSSYLILGWMISGYPHFGILGNLNPAGDGFLQRWIACRGSCTARSAINRVSWEENVRRASCRSAKESIENGPWSQRDHSWPQLCNLKHVNFVTSRVVVSPILCSCEWLSLMVQQVVPLLLRTRGDPSRWAICFQPGH